MALAGDRFTLGSTLGSGGMGVVYRVHDNLLDQDVALKTLRGTGARDLFRFKREFRSLADLDHPNLCELYELHTAADEWFFTMELVEGVGFLDWVRPVAQRVGDDDPTLPRTGTPAVGGGAGRRGQLDMARLGGALPQLVAGVQALHRAGKLHRDLKPSNVMVTPRGRVVLLDFGLVSAVVGDDRTHERVAVGTPTYMSPEQAADLPLSPASDWYSVGVMLYEALTGRRPFEGAAEQVLRRKQTDPPPPPGAIASGLPPALERLCLELLAVEPAARPDGDAILRALGTSAPADGHGDALPSLFVGREAELAVLREAWDAARAGAVEVVVVRGESGIGKSAIVRAFLDERRADALVLFARCYDRESVPFKAIDPIIDAVASTLLAMPAEAVEALLPRETAALARLFPVLRRVPAVADRMVGTLQPRDLLELRSRAFAGLRELLRGLARQRPIVIAIDDLQWGDEDSAALLADLIHYPEALALLLVLVQRSDDEGGVVDRVIAPPAAFAAGEVRLIALGPLADADARLLAGRLGAGDETTEVAIRDAHGHPMFLTELVASPRQAAHAATVEEVIQTRLHALAESALRILQVVAVASEPVALGLALRAAGAVASGSDLRRLRRERLVRVRQRAEETTPRIEPYHDRVRRAVLAQLDDADVRAVHAALARALETEGAAADAGVIAHWLGAGEPARAAGYAVSAASVAEEQLAFHRAASLYQLALDHAVLAPIARRQLRRRRAEALVNAGQLPAAAAEFARAAEGADADERLELDQRRLEQLLRSGAADEGLALARDVLARVGHHLPLDDGAVVRAIVIERIRIRLRGLRFEPRGEGELAPGELRRLDTLRSVATSLTLGNPIHGRLLQFQFLRAALAAGEPRRVCVALTFEIGYHGQVGSRSLARQDQLRAAIAGWEDRLDDPLIGGLADMLVGFGRYLAGRYREARELMERGLAICQETGGARWETDVGNSFLLGVLWQLGETRALSRLVPLLLREASDRGDVFAQRALRGWRGNVAWLVAGRPTAARSHLAAAAAASTDPSLSVQRFYELSSALQIDLYEGELGLAAARLAEVSPRLGKSHLLRVQTIRIELAFLRGRLALAQQIAGEPHEREVARAIRALRKERTPGAVAMADQLAVTQRWLGGDREGIAETLDALIEAYDAADLHLLATVGRWRRALVDGEAGRARVEETIAAMQEAAIADPAAIARMLWPWPDPET